MPLNHGIAIKFSFVCRSSHRISFKFFCTRSRITEWLLLLLHLLGRNHLLHFNFYFIYLQLIWFNFEIPLPVKCRLSANHLIHDCFKLYVLFPQISHLVQFSTSSDREYTAHHSNQLFGGDVLCRTQKSNPTLPQSTQSYQRSPLLSVSPALHVPPAARNSNFAFPVHSTLFSPSLLPSCSVVIQPRAVNKTFLVTGLIMLRPGMTFAFKSA